MGSQPDRQATQHAGGS